MIVSLGPCVIQSRATPTLSGRRRMLVLPNNLLRFNCKEEHALQFIEGQIRFGRLSHYRGIEGSRQDETEGLVFFYWDMKSDQNIHYRGRSINPYYILCTTHPNVAEQMMVKKFGSFIVRISDPLLLLERIKVVWKNHASAFADNACLVPVAYNKDGLLEPNQYLYAPTDYTYSQKPASLEYQQEFRYVLPCSDVQRNSDCYLTLDVGDCRDICTLQRGSVD